MTVLVLPTSIASSKISTLLGIGGRGSGVGDQKRRTARTQRAQGTQRLVGSAPRSDLRSLTPDSRSQHKIVYQPCLPYAHGEGSEGGGCLAAVVQLPEGGRVGHAYIVGAGQGLGGKGAAHGVAEGRASALAPGPQLTGGV